MAMHKQAIAKLTQHKTDQVPVSAHGNTMGTSLRNQRRRQYKKQEKRCVLLRQGGCLLAMAPQTEPSGVGIGSEGAARARSWGYRGMYAIIAISCLCQEESLKGLKD